MFALQHCWVLYCDLICLDYDGNLLDACVTALIAALRICKCPVHYFTFLQKYKLTPLNGKVEYVCVGNLACL